jgi:hypothetical protein
MNDNLNLVEKIGEIKAEVIQLLELEIMPNTPIYIGASNIAHMAQEHSYEFNRFFDKIPHIIDTADFVRLKKDDNSIEYIKLFGKYLKLSIRIAGDNNYYVRSLYFVENNRIERLLKNNELKRLTKQ